MEILELNGHREGDAINFRRLQIFAEKVFSSQKCLVFGRSLAKWIDWLVKPGEEAI